MISKANFTKAKLYKTNLQNTYLEEANFTEAMLVGADLSGCYRKEAVLCSAVLEEQNSLTLSVTNGISLTLVLNMPISQGL